MKKIIPFLLFIPVFFGSCETNNSVFQFKQKSNPFGIPTEMYNVFIESLGGWTPYHIPTEHQTVDSLINKLKIIATQQNYHIGDTLDTGGDNKNLDLNVRTFMKKVVSKKGGLCFCILEIVGSSDYQVVINSTLNPARGANRRFSSSTQRLIVSLPPAFRQAGTVDLATGNHYNNG